MVGQRNARLGLGLGFLLVGLVLPQSAEAVLSDDAATTRPWWDDYPAIATNCDLPTAQQQNATVYFGGLQTDPSWGIYGQKVTENPQLTKDVHAAGLKGISYYETFGTATSFIVELAKKAAGQDYTPIKVSHWAWQYYAGGTIAWVGPQNYFDCPSFAGAWTRLHPRYGGRAMTYPDGTVATGYFNNDSSDPRNSRVLDASGAKDLLGVNPFEPGYNDAVNEINPSTGKPKGPITGLIPIGGKYAGHISIHKDSACPFWIDTDRASVLYAADQGTDGIWTDNFSPWDSFGYPPAKMAFGDWSVAGFRTYLAQHFTPTQLTAMGVTNASTFDVRAALRAKALLWGGNDQNLDDGVWNNSRWLDDPLWRAYKIYKRQTGSAALSNYYNSLKDAARLAGKPEFLICGNDIPFYSLGWPRGDLDMVSTEMSGGWHMGSSSRGVTLPPMGRFAPVYKLAREHARSRLVNIWFYLDSPYDIYRGHAGIADVLEYEMLATNALPMHFPNEPHLAGNNASNAAFFKFVSQSKVVFGARRPIEDVGIYYSTSSLLSFMTPAGFLDMDHQPHSFAYLGWGTALGELHIPYRPVPEWKLTADTLAGLRALVIPSAEVFDPADVTQIIEPWVRAGGLLIVTGNSGYRAGEAGNFEPNAAGLSLAPLTGIANQASAPAQQLREVGAGRVLYLRSNIGMDFYTNPQGVRNILRPQIGAAMSDLLIGKDPLSLAADPAVPNTIGLTVYDDATARRLFIDVNNCNINLDTDQTTPATNLKCTVSLPAWIDPAKQYNVKTRVLVPAGTAPQAGYRLLDPSHAEITLSSVNVYASIVLDFTERTIARPAWRGYE